TSSKRDWSSDVCSSDLLIMSAGKVIFGTLVPVIFALLLNEIRVTWAKRSIQTIVYLPNFLSWAVLSAVVINLFEYYGPINSFLEIGRAACRERVCLMVD